MKKNTKTYLLLAVVLGIWGVIGYKVFNTIAPEPEQNTLAAVTKFTPKAIKEKDTFSIIADYRDPFLGTIKKTKKVNKIKKLVVKKETLPEINVLYTGHIMDDATQEKIFFVSINGKQELMTIGTSINKVTLLSGSKTKIKVKVRKKVSTILLQE